MTAKGLTVIGLVLDILGVCFLVWNEISAKIMDVKESKIEDDYLVRIYVDAKQDKDLGGSKGEPVQITAAEQDYFDSEKKIKPESGLRRAVLGLWLVLTGFVLQLLAQFY